MLNQLVQLGAAIAFIVGASLVGLYAAAPPARNLLRRDRDAKRASQRGALAAATVHSADDRRFAERRRKLGLVGAALCAAASLAFAIAFSTQTM